METTLYTVFYYKVISYSAKGRNHSWKEKQETVWGHPACQWWSWPESTESSWFHVPTDWAPPTHTAVFLRGPGGWHAALITLWFVGGGGPATGSMGTPRPQLQTPLLILPTTQVPIKQAGPWESLTLVLDSKPTLATCLLFSREKSLSHVWLFVTPRTVAHQAPPSVGFSRQEYWRGLPFPSPGDVPDPGVEPRSPALQGDTLPSEPPRKLFSKTMIFFRFPWWLSGKEYTFQCRRLKRHEFDPWVGKISWSRKWKPAPIFLPRECHGQRSPAGYSPCVTKRCVWVSCSLPKSQIDGKEICFIFRCWQLEGRGGRCLSKGQLSPTAGNQSGKRFYRQGWGRGNYMQKQHSQLWHWQSSPNWSSVVWLVPSWLF